VAGGRAAEALDFAGRPPGWENLAGHLPTAVTLPRNRVMNRQNRPVVTKVDLLTKNLIFLGGVVFIQLLAFPHPSVGSLPINRLSMAASSSRLKGLERNSSMSPAR